ncbi:MAG: FixH family protein [Burkholderiaceae bacterium]|nr:FixH family protein [Burkholderiaceae bacterium]
MQATLVTREAMQGQRRDGRSGGGKPPQGAPPWYRHRWPWLLAIAPAAALLGGIVTLWLAVTTSDSLVVDDYYREGRAINQQLARDRLAAALGLRAELRFEPGGANAGDVVALQLSAERGSAWPPELRLRIVHATIASLDREHRLAHVGNGRYLVSGAAPDSGGRWLVQVEDAGRTWRLVAPAVTRFDAPLTLRAGAQ